MIAPSSATISVMISKAPLSRLPPPRSGPSRKPPSSEPMIPTTMLSRMPCWASVRMTMLASQPMMPPMISAMMRFIFFPPVLTADEPERFQRRSDSKTREARACSCKPSHILARGSAEQDGDVLHRFGRVLKARRSGARRSRPHGSELLLALVKRLVVLDARSEEHTSELQSLMRISYAVFCLKKKTTKDYHDDEN